MLTVPTPSLRTLAIKPSWVNRAGRIDRSACMELRASDLWPRVREIDWRKSPSPSADSARTICNAQPRERVGVRVRILKTQPTSAHAPARLVSSHQPQRSRREASTLFTIHARLLANLHDTRLPQQLAGDMRTRKSNAMNSHLRAPKLPFAVNPNKGSTRIKRLGLWSGREAAHALSPATAGGWTQQVRIERWRLHARLAQHFLICPRCKRKHLKLVMPLATTDEVNDAEFAEGWIRLLDARHTAARQPMPRELAQRRARIIDRYAVLFRGRQLVCRRCLHMRYGEVKWQRQRMRAGL